MPRSGAATIVREPPSMSRFLLRLGLLAWPLAGLLQAAVAAPTPPETLRPPPGWPLRWSDEFDVDGPPDPDKWANDTHHNREGWPNHESQYYAPAGTDNAVVRDGILRITARREELPDAPDWGGQHYTSARLMTRGLAEWTGGFFEARARLPCGAGTWPAIWTLGSQGDWPANGEIDLMEQPGFWPGRILSTLHTAAGSGAHGVGARVWLPDACEVFHRYQMLWTDQEIRIGVDGFEHLVYPRLDVGDAGARRAWPFDRPQYLLLNVALGGSLGGAIDDAVLPATLEVDYVRVWQPAPVAERRDPPADP